MSQVDVSKIASQLTKASIFYNKISYVEETGSTNLDLLAAENLEHGTVLIASHQIAGKGRFDRRWEAEPGASVAVSVLVKPRIEKNFWFWMSLLTGVGVARGISTLGVAKVQLKWPNDVLVNGKKICGILCHVKQDAIIAGFGINVKKVAPQFLSATCLADEGLPTDENALIAAVLNQVEQIFAKWDHGFDPRDIYRASCSTIGQQVKLMVDAQQTSNLAESNNQGVEGVAVDIDEWGALIIETPDAKRAAYSAGDVIHLRPA